MTEQADLINKLGLDSPTQVCLVVRELEQAAQYYENVLGIGPFVFPKIHYKEITYLGQPSDGYWEMAFARMGPLELELSCPLQTPSIYEDFLNEHGEGLHHLGFDIDDLDATIAQAESLGIGVLMSGRTDQGGFAHLDTRKVGGTIFEAIQRPAPRV
ncbi:MAG: lactoylglutathione lyase [Planctomycetaceae bacterium]|nr:lactoylglutathione lyase [Planctomycetaceae bacterium]MCH2594785.1 VOC family protein [Pirellulales bacterium]HCK40233.1 lactoylglutathione lyase [Planctomycetaceae bacterium]